MKKLFASLTIVAALIFGMSMNAVAQEAEAAQVAQQEETVADVAEEAVVVEKAVVEEFSKALKTKFIEGDAHTCHVAFCLIFGLAFAIELSYLNLNSINSKNYCPTSTKQ